MKIKYASELLALIALILFLMHHSPCRGHEKKSESTYVGSLACKDCHPEEYENFITYAKKSTSFQSVEKQMKHLTPDEIKQCYPCHTTGYGQPGGFVSLEETPHLKNAGCEVCHGPGGTYTQDGYMTLKNKEFKRADIVAVGLIHPIGEAVCTQCHNEENPIPDYTFDYEAMKATGLHESTPLKYNHD